MTVQEFYPIFLNNPEICTDSRQARQGSIFFALKGDLFDGNRYAAKALDNGCAIAVVDDPELKNTKHMVWVDDVLSFLQQFAHYHRSQFDIPLIALTGSNGKTTTKELIAAVLKQSFKVLYTSGNLNNHIGVPLTLLRLNKTHEIALIEMGANHIGEIDQLCQIAQPNGGLITNIGKAHLEGFGSFEGVVRAKTELYRYLIAEKGLIFMNEDDDLLVSQIGSYPFEGYGSRRMEPKLSPDFRLSFSFKPIGLDQMIGVKTHLIGPYNLTNALAALAVGKHFGVDWTEGAKALCEYQPGNNRSQWLDTGNNHLILDAYNANISSLKLVFGMFRDMPAKNKMAILGEMLELGIYSADAHREILDLVKESGIPVLLVGKEFVKVNSLYQFPAYETVDELMEDLQARPPRNQTILLKGSRGNQLEKVVSLL